MKKSCLTFLAIVLLMLSACSHVQENKSSGKKIPQEPEKKVEQEIQKQQPTEELVLPLEGKIIVVDAGHGISSYNKQEPIAPNSTETKNAFVSGTRGQNLTEEELNLAVALKLKSALEEQGAQVHMTRETHETQLSNIGRAEFANELKADISVKIHADGNVNSAVHGVSMLVPSNLYIDDESVCRESKIAGTLILQEVVKSTGAADRGVVERGDMTGFNWSKVPVVLLEMGFMTNPEEDAKMETDEYREKIVSGIVNGLIKYFE